MSLSEVRRSRRLDVDDLKSSVIQGLEHLKIKIGLANIDDLRRRLIELQLEKMAREMDPEEMKKMNFGKIFKIYNMENLVKNFGLDKLMIWLDHGLNMNDVVENVEYLMKMDIVNLARIVDSVIKDVDFEYLRNGVLSIIESLEKTLSDLDLDNLVEEVVKLISDVNQLDLSKVWKNIKRDGSLSLVKLLKIFEYQTIKIRKVDLMEILGDIEWTFTLKNMDLMNLVKILRWTNQLNRIVNTVFQALDIESLQRVCKYLIKGKKCFKVVGGVRH